MNLSIFLPALLGMLWLVESGAAQNAPPPSPQYPALPSETQAKFYPPSDSLDYIKRDVMIPMGDEVKLHTVILIPKKVRNAPILLTRTPYDATELTSHAQSSHLGPILHG